MKTIFNNIHNLELFYELPWSITLMFLTYFASELSGTTHWLAFMVDADTYEGGVKFLSGFVGFLLVKVLAPQDGISK